MRYRVVRHSLHLYLILYIRCAPRSSCVSVSHFILQLYTTINARSLMRPLVRSCVHSLWSRLIEIILPNFSAFSLLHASERSSALVCFHLLVFPTHREKRTSSRQKSRCAERNETSHRWEFHELVLSHCWSRSFFRFVLK